MNQIINMFIYFSIVDNAIKVGFNFDILLI